MRLPQIAMVRVTWICGGCDRHLQRTVAVTSTQPKVAIACPWCDPDVAMPLHVSEVDEG